MTAQGRSLRPPLMPSLLAGLAAGAAAAVAGAALSLPLRSPDDAVFNTLSVSLGALVVGLIGGAVWQRTRAVVPFVCSMDGLLLALIVGLALGEQTLSGLVRFGVPVAIVIFAVVEVTTPLLAWPALRPQIVGPMGAVVALVMGLTLAGRGDAPSGQLKLPDLPPPSQVRQPTPPPAVAQASPGPASADASPTPPPIGVAASGPINTSMIRRQDVAGASYTISPADSLATYTVREKLVQLPLPNDAVGRTSTLSGTLYLDGRASTITVDLRTLTSDQPRRDNYIRTMPGGPELNRYPIAEFTATDIAGLPEEYRPGETITRQVTGLLKLRETERLTTFTVQARYQDNVLYVLGTTEFTWADFRIPPPNVANIVKVEDTIKLNVLIVATRDAGT